MAGGMGLHSIELRSASIYEHGLPPASFDYPYSRHLLIHQNHPVEAMKQGGVMVFEEAAMQRTSLSTIVSGAADFSRRNIRA